VFKKNNNQKVKMDSLPRPIGSLPRYFGEIPPTRENYEMDFLPPVGGLKRFLLPLVRQEIS